MSIIFPTEPAKVNIHPLPAKANFISYREASGGLALKAWMPSGIASVVKIDRRKAWGANDQFYEYHCSGCPRSRTSYYEINYKELFDQYYDGNGERPDSKLYNEGTECCVHYYGYRGQECPLEKNPEEIQWDEDYTFPISDTTIEIFLTSKLRGSTADGLRGTAKLCSGMIIDGEIYHTRDLRSGNCWELGNICWGYNSVPETLREMVNTYLYSPFNDDLTGLATYEHNCEKMEKLKKDKESIRYKSDYDKFLCQGYDNLMILDKSKDLQAFFFMLMAGFTPLPEFPHYMIIPMDTCTIVKNDNYYLGYKTEPDAVGRSWYISSEGFLIGQLDDTYSYA
jgi:hypothetical protein